MLFNNPPHMFRLLSILELSWNKDIRHADPRDFHALSFRMDGGSDFIYKNKTVHAKKNSLSFVPEGISYDLEHAHEHLYVVHFKTDKELKNEDIFSFVPKAYLLYQNLFKKMYDVWNGKQPGYYYLASSYFYSIMGNIQNELTAPPQEDKMSKVTEFIHANFTDSYLSISYLAELFGTSETYFRKAFKNIYNTTPLKYINDLRTDYALELLRSGYFSVNEVAEKAGFSDPKYFSRVIKNKTDICPSKING